MRRAFPDLLADKDQAEPTLPIRANNDLQEALLQACRVGDVEAVDRLLKVGADVGPDEWDSSEEWNSAEEDRPLSVARKKGYLNVARQLATHAGFSETLQNLYLFFTACVAEDIQEAERLAPFLIDKDLPEKALIELRQMLFDFCSSGNVSIVQCLIKAGLDVNIQKFPLGFERYRIGPRRGPRSDCFPPLLPVAVKNKDLTMVRYLVGAGADLNEEKEHGRPVIFLAIEEEILEMTVFLLSSGASLSALTLPDLYKLAFNGSIGIMHFLLEQHKILSEGIDTLIKKEWIFFTACCGGDAVEVGHLLEEGG